MLLRSGRAMWLALGRSCWETALVVPGSGCAGEFGGVAWLVGFRVCARWRLCW